MPARSAFLRVSDLTPTAGEVLVVAASLETGNDLSLGSFRVRVGYDPEKLRFIGEAPVPGILQAVNPQTGDILVVGAAAGPEASETLCMMRFRIVDPAGINSLVLRIDELNDAEFVNRTATIVRAARLVLDESLGASPLPTNSAETSTSSRSPVTAASVVIDSITPASGELDNERVTDLTVYGRGFAPRDNVLLIGDREVPGLLSENGGTVIRVPAPVIRAPEGRLRVRVTSAGTRSNAVSFVVKRDRR